VCGGGQERIGMETGKLEKEILLNYKCREERESNFNGVHNPKNITSYLHMYVHTCDLQNEHVLLRL